MCLTTTPVFANSCDEEELRNALTLLKLSPSIRTNSHFLEELRILYGRNFYDEVKKSIKHMPNDPSGKINSKTVKHVIDMGFGDKAEATMYLASLFGPETDYNSIAFVMDLVHYNARIFHESSHKYLLVRAFFLSPEQLNAVRNRFINDDKYALALQHLEIIMPDLNRNESLHLIKTMVKELFRGYGTPSDKGYANPRNLKLKDGNTIVLQGHGGPACDTVVGYITGHSEDGVTFESVHYEEVVKTLKKIEINEYSNILLSHCYAATGCSSDEIPSKTAEELKDLFLQNKLKSTFMGEKKNSYAYKFADYFYSELPYHEGEIFGYVGIQSSVELSSYYKVMDSKGKYKIHKMVQTSVIIKDENKKSVRFDKSELLQFYKASSFPSH